ncbi:hypothetical protein N752_06545 [Desulforamulus aquiferis]|nr:hypothetical protein N752_06545 [Desulforamulus aquiferis]
MKKTKQKNPQMKAKSDIPNPMEQEVGLTEQMKVQEKKS